MPASSSASIGDFLRKFHALFHEHEFRRQLLARRGARTLAIDLTHPFFMYLSAAQGVRYETAISQPEFQQKIYAPIAELYDSSFRRLADTIRAPYDYVDLGPGYTSYLAIADEILFRRKPPRFYVPVDVNLHLLRKACQFARQLPVTTLPINTSFELLPDQLDAIQLANGPVAKIFNIGLTFNNYSYRGAVRLLRNLLGPDDAMLLCAESPDGIAPDDLLLPYQDAETEAFNRASIARLGLPAAGLKYHVTFKNGRIEMGFLVTRRTGRGRFRLVPGDFLRTCISHRYQVDALVRRLKEDFARVRLLNVAKRSAEAPAFFSVLIQNH